MADDGPLDRIDEEEYDEEESGEVTYPECLICEGLILPTLESLQPCRCGHYVHNSCLLRVVQLYEAEHTGCAILSCIHCKTIINITPRKSSAFRLLELSSSIFFSLYKIFCYVGCGLIIYVLCDTIYTVAGIGLLYKLYGHKATEDMLLSMDPILAVTVCKAIPVISMCINCIPWEAKLLQLFRRYKARSTPAGPTAAEVPQAAAQATVREAQYRRTPLGAFVGGLLLPCVGAWVGDKLFGAVSSPVLRLVLGGLTFVTVKGGLMMCYRQREYERLCCSLRVAPYRGD